MPLAAGSKLSFYEVLAPLGAGAMGEVWRAKDTRLGREVAIKVLPEHFASDEERLRRFEREAKTLASLNHPNVAQIFGVDQVGDTCFLVLELVPGESLDERLKRGPLPVDEALEVVEAIADGLEAAHEAGVIHRDLKPANVRLTPEGKVKVLDFGLAKPAREGHEGSSTDSVLATEAGRLLGTPTYMAPEQARGKPIDKRVDIWAFGCVLYECLTARRAFAGETLTDVLAAVLHTEPDLARLPAATPARVREILADCLAKDPRQRARDIGEVRRQLERARREPAAPKKSASTTSTIAIALFAALASSIAGALVSRALQSKTPRAAREPTRFVVTFPESAKRSKGSFKGLALSPDGRTLAACLRGEHYGLYLREFAQAEPRKLPGVEAPNYVAFAPDGRSLAYFDRNHDTLCRVALDGGKPRALVSQSDVTGLDWSTERGIATAPVWGEGIVSVQPLDGAVAPLSKFDVQAGDRAQGSPCFLPGGKKLLFQVWTGGEWSEARIDLLDLETGARTTAQKGATAPRYLPFGPNDGALLFARANALWARRFDPRAGTCSGDEVLLIEGLQVDGSSGTAECAVSPSGTFAYQPRIEGLGKSHLVWVDREGKEERAANEALDYNGTSISADGKRAVYARGGAVFTIFSVDLDVPLEQRRPRRVTFEGDCSEVRISPDGKRIAFTSNTNGIYQLYLQELEGGAPPRRLLEVPCIPAAWSRDGRWIAVQRQGESERGEIWIVAADGPEPPRPFVQLKGNAYDPQFSPDGQWLSYISDAEGEGQIQVLSFPSGERRVQVLNGEGYSPRWSLDGSELFFRNDGEYFAVPVTRQPVLAFGTPRRMFRGTYSTDWMSVCFQQAPDGRFLLDKPDIPEDLVLRVVVVEDFVEEVKAKLGVAAR